MSGPPLVYAVLGSAGSGRRELVRDLAEHLVSQGERVAIAGAAHEPAGPADAALRALPGATLCLWSFHGPALSVEAPSEASVLFLVADGAGDPVDFVEALSLWLPASGWELGRILSVIDCARLCAHPALLQWYEACVHFSDYVLLGRREGVPNKWLSDFEARFKKLCYPCHFEPLKSGRVKNPALLLEPEARRLSQVFDAAPARADIEIAIEDEDGRPLEDAEDEADAPPAPDPYFERLLNGRRAKPLPRIEEHPATV